MPEGMERHESISEKSEREGLTSLNLEVDWFNEPLRGLPRNGLGRNCMVNDHDSYLLPIHPPASWGADEHGEGRVR